MKKILLVFFFLFLISSCRVQYVADYDEKVRDEIINIFEVVERFYLKILLITEDERTYKKFEADYLDIEVNLQTLLLRNQIRPLNDESIKQTENVIKLWTEDKNLHKKDNKINDFILNRHRDQFRRMFIAMIKGEEVKKL